ncbi:MAG: 2-hydroxyacid dehydrogenase [Flavobacteriales bacterium]
MNLAVFSTKPYDKEYFEKFKNEYDIKISYYEANLKPNTAKLTKDFDAVCVFVNDVLNKKTVETIAKKGVRLIALRCAGFNNVDLNACKENNIKVVRVPAYSPEAVAEHAMALILTLNRKTHKAYNRVREGNFSLTNLIGFNLYKKVVGVVGTGKIGAAFCRIAKGFGCEVLAYDIHKNEELEKNGVKYVSLDELFNKSDVISLHCPLNEKTKHIIDKSSIEKMKKGVLLVNTSRGALVNTKDVITGLKSKKIAFLGIDVYEQEENLFFKDLSESIIKDDLLLRLNSFPNVLITSHQAFFTKEAMTEITTTTLNNIQEFMNDEKLTNEVS